MPNARIVISDPTLRDGNHAVRHQLKEEQIAAYCQAADAAGVSIVEVGHGNGLGASSLLVGEAATTDYAALTVARENLKNSNLGIHVIPGFATIERDLKPALELGVDVVRVASHCTEADICERHISFCRNIGVEVWGCLMMSHMISPSLLLEQARKMESYGAEGVVFMDSAGYYVPEDVRQRVDLLVNELSIAVGFHAHNNLGLAIANSLAAAESGATLLDGCARGFGAGAGNASLEILVAVLQKLGYDTGIDLYKMLDAADLAEKILMKEIPVVRSVSVVSGLAGVFSGFMKPVTRIAKEFNVDPRDIFFELGKRKIVAGQEDMILEVAKDLSQIPGREQQ
ncbi:MAG: 4-hydroxy-2-oxovalerate aldolase [Gammaproteobacteria bacterium]|nr:4-hydroxy-2-oxovalerate aldolase [Gammaproteobacteria bacterium]